jgi:hypothetical protein
MKKTVYNEAFTTLDEAMYFMEVRVARHNHQYIDEAKLYYVNGHWSVGLMFSDTQKEMDFDG